MMAILLIGTAGMGNAWADRGHAHIGVMVGPYWGPWYYPSTYYYPPYYPPVVVESSDPQVYLEQQRAASAAPAAPGAAASGNFWHYCASPKGYYPYVKECPGGWKKVSPQPPAQP